jgi:hypothetical protein
LTVLVCSGVFTSATAFAKSNTTEEERVCKITYDYANCVVRRRHDLAAEVIVSNYDNGTISNKYARLIDSDCMERVAGAVGVRFPADHYRYALADALVNMDFLTKEPDSFSDRLPLAHPPMPSAAERDAALAATKSKSRRAEIQKKYDNAVGVVWLSQYGECIVRQSPKDARYLLLTPPNTPEETSRISALRPVFADCLPEGTLRFNRLTLRGTIALNYYRLAMATPQLESGSAH